MSDAGPGPVGDGLPASAKLAARSAPRGALTDCPCVTTPERDEYGNTEWADCPVHVDCDDRCRALRKPQTPEEVRAALTHWEEHSYLSGCSHGC